jgi:predicted DNA-binding transcriptional regulator AlpA
VTEMPDERTSVLPRSCPPRGLNRAQSAEYVGVSPAHFDKMVREGLMPGPINANARKNIWDRVELDEAFSSLRSDDKNPFDELPRGK